LKKHVRTGGLYRFVSWVMCKWWALPTLQNWSETMIIIFGSRMYGVNNVEYSFGECSHCGSYGKLKSYNGRKWGHIFFIPLIPESKHMRVIKECRKCEQGLHVPHEEVARTVEEQQRSLKSCIEAIALGKTSFLDPVLGQETDTSYHITHVVETYFIVGVHEGITELYDSLEHIGAEFELLLAQSKHCELEGRLDDAATFLRQALEVRPQSLMALGLLAKIFQVQNKHRLALDVYQQLTEVNGDDVGMYLYMADSLEAMGDYVQLRDVLNKCLKMAPELRDDKKFRKYHIKCTKKAEKLEQR